MILQNYKTLLIVVTIIISLLVASPALQRLLVYPQTDFFTELWLLGSEKKAENYPFNITLGGNYKIFLGVSNHLGRCTYYLVQMKFRTQNQSAPDTFARTPSNLPPLYNASIFVADKETVELPLIFSFDYMYDEENLRINFNRVVINNAWLDLNGYSANWDNENSRFLGNLFFELWIYNDTISSFQYHQRYVDLKLNMTV